MMFYDFCQNNSTTIVPFLEQWLRLLPLGSTVFICVAGSCCSKCQDLTVPCYVSRKGQKRPKNSRLQWKENDIQEVTWLLTKYSTNILLQIHCWQCLRLCVLSLNHQPTAGCFFLHHTVNIKIQTCMCFIYGLVAYLLPVFRLNLAIIILLYWALQFVSWQCCALLISRPGMAQPTQLKNKEG